MFFCIYYEDEIRKGDERVIEPGLLNFSLSLSSKH